MNLKINPKTPLGPLIANKPQVLKTYLQFRSIAIINKKKYFSIFNLRTNKSFWISEGENFENYRVTYYNSTDETISITDGINTEIIPIITANETPLSVVSGGTDNPEGINLPNPGPKVDNKEVKDKKPPRRRVIPVKR